VLGALAIGGVMILFTRNPVFALLPLLGLAGYLGPLFARQRRKVGVIDVDGAGVLRPSTPTMTAPTSPPLVPAPISHPLSPQYPPASSHLPTAPHSPTLPLIPFPVAAHPGQTVHVEGDPRATVPLVRTWLLAEALAAPPGAFAIQAVPPDSSWAWTRWLLIH
jgi:hypothetical protein